MMSKDEHDSGRDSSDPFLVYETVTLCIALVFALYLLERCGL